MNRLFLFQRACDKEWRVVKESDFSMGHIDYNLTNGYGKAIVYDITDTKEILYEELKAISVVNEKRNIENSMKRKREYLNKRIEELNGKEE